ARRREMTRGEMRRARSSVATRTLCAKADRNVYGGPSAATDVRAPCASAEVMRATFFSDPPTPRALMTNRTSRWLSSRSPHESENPLLIAALFSGAVHSLHEAAWT